MHECQFHATAIYATGGMVLSGDDLTAIPPARAGDAAQAAAADRRRRRVRRRDAASRHACGCRDARMVCLFNWDDAPRTLPSGCRTPATVTDYWTGESLGRRDGALSIDMAPRFRAAARGRRA